MKRRKAAKKGHTKKSKIIRKPAAIAVVSDEQDMLEEVILPDVVANDQSMAVRSIMLLFREINLAKTLSKSSFFKAAFLSLIPSGLLDEACSSGDGSGAFTSSLQAWIHSTFLETQQCVNEACCFLKLFSEKTFCPKHCSYLDLYCLAASCLRLGWKKYFLLQADSPVVERWLSIGGCEFFREKLLQKPTNAFSYSLDSEGTIRFCNSLLALKTQPEHRKWAARLCRGKSETRPIKKPAATVNENELPVTLSGFAQHPLYVLQSKIPKLAALLPDAQPVGTFRNDKIFLRSNLSPLKSKEAWLRQARSIKVIAYI